MKRFLLLPMLASAWLCHAQTLTGTTGGTMVGANLILEYAVGELATFTMGNTQGVVTQGLLQPRIVSPPPNTGNALLQQLVNTTGGTLSAANMTLEYSIGEIATFTINDVQQVVTQGLLQPDPLQNPGSTSRVVQPLTGAAPSIAGLSRNIELEWSVYPNPATDKLNMQIMLPKTSLLHIQLLASDGKAVQEVYAGAADEGLFQWQTNVRGLPAGAYYVYVTTSQGVFGKRITVVQ